ncbi:hypothetical protein QYE76_035272 [Lolium multiflorum]|uniref:Uncharacterized protein n=1 Tax=Lolium multiflorum TaxID=4521 RepID=A0AAD8VM00_LOLMU|nr:hypothetical protein QYE76_035272 [Lolium multiflorum]
MRTPLKGAAWPSSVTSPARPRAPPAARASCLKPPRRRDGALHDAAAAASASTTGAWYRAALACCGYALLVQLAALAYEVASTWPHVTPDALLLPGVQALAWASLLGWSDRVQRGRAGVQR